MEDDTSLEDGDVHHLGARGVMRVIAVGVGGSLFGGMPLDETDAQVFDQEGKEETGHQDGGGSRLVLELAQAFVAEHEDRMSEQLAELSVMLPEELGS